MIILNRALCLHCLEFVVSTHTHDFRSCKCGAVTVDGGQEYLRRVGRPEDREERSIFIKTDDSDPTDLWIIFGPSGKDNPSVLFYHPKDAAETARKMMEDHRRPFYIAQVKTVPTRDAEVK